MTKILVDKLPETCSDCPLYQAPIIIPITNELSQNIPAKCSIGEKNPKCWSWFQEVLNDDER